MPNPILDALFRLQPGAKRMDLPGGGGFDDDLAREGILEGGFDTQPSLYGLQNQRKAELQERLANESAFPSGNLNRLKSQMSFLEQDMAPMDTAIRANQAAEVQGFPSSQAQAQFGRDFDTWKTGIPLQQAQITGQANVQGRQIAADQARDVASIRAKTDAERYREAEETKRQGFGALQGILGGKGLPPGARVSTTGSGGFSYSSPAARNPNVNSLINSLAEERAFGQDPSAIGQYERGIVGGLNLDPNTEDFIYELLEDPEFANMTPEQAIGTYDPEALIQEGIDPTLALNAVHRIRGTKAPTKPEPSKWDLLMQFLGRK